MNKVKKFLLFTIVMATVCALMTIPASALNGYVYDNGNEDGYYWNSSLKSTGNTVTASIDIMTNTGDPSDIYPMGVVPSSLSVSLNGVISYDDSNGSKMIYPLSDSKYGNNVSLLTAYDQVNVSDIFGRGCTVVGARCSYKAMDKAAGNELCMGVQYNVN